MSRCTLDRPGSGAGLGTVSAFLAALAALDAFKARMVAGDME